MAPAFSHPSSLATATASGRTPRGRRMLRAGVALIVLLIGVVSLMGNHDIGARAGASLQDWSLSSAKATGGGAVRRADWAADPGWDGGHCKRLLANPLPYTSNCSRPADALTCTDGQELMFSQFQQDHYLYTNHFRHLRRPGVYLDVASNYALHFSNSAFFDRCLGWAGTCVEGNPKFYERLWRQRSCDVVPTCVGEVEGEVVNFTFAAGRGGVTDTNKNALGWQNGNQQFPSQMLRCTTLGQVVARSGRVEVDFLSLDVEGHEAPVLRGIDWTTTRIKVIMVETSATNFGPISTILEAQGFVHREQDKGLHKDSLFVHSSVKWGSPE